MTPVHALLKTARSNLSIFIRFCGVGATGFLVNAVMLYVFLRCIGNLSVAYVLSFVVAVLATFEINRRWTFHRGGGAYFAMLSAYVGAQSVGFLVNVAVFAAMRACLPDPLNRPFICLSTAAGVALVFNYVSARVAVFR